MVFALFVVIILGSSQALTLSPVQVDGGAWQLTASLDQLSVDTKSATGTNYNIDFDVDDPITTSAMYGASGLEGMKPGVHLGLGSSFRSSDELPRSVEGYTAYIYAIDLDFKSMAKQYGNSIHYESEQVACTGSFTVKLSEGAWADPPDGVISDVWIVEYESGLSEFPGASTLEVQSLFKEGDITPIIMTSSQAGEGLIYDGSGTREAKCRISVSMRAGGAITWATFLIFPVAQTVHVYNVYAKYTLYVEVLVEAGGKAPIPNPFAIILAILQDFGFRIRDLFDRMMDALGIFIWVVIAVIILLFYLLCIRNKRR